MPTKTIHFAYENSPAILCTPPKSEKKIKHSDNIGKVTCVKCIQQWAADRAYERAKEYGNQYL